jgi:PAS domain S-box-containing protein
VAYGQTTTSGKNQQAPAQGTDAPLVAPRLPQDEVSAAPSSQHSLPPAHPLALLYELTPQGTITYLSADWQSILGAPPATLLHQPLLTYLALKDQAAAGEMIVALRTQRMRDHAAVWRWQHPAGATCQLAVTHHTVLDAAGQVLLISGSAQPILSDAGANATLQEQLDFYESLINALPDPLFVKDENHRMILVNAAHCQLAGLTPAQILQEDEGAFVLPEELAVFRAQDTLAFNSTEPVANEETLTDSQGQPHVIATRKVAHQLPNGQRILIGAMRDITDRRRMEERLQREQALLRRLIDSIPDLIFYKDMENRYAGCNQAFEELIGLPEADFVGLTTADLFPEAEHQRFEQQDRAVLQERVTMRTEQQVTYASGRRVLLDTLLTPFSSPTGEPLGLLGICRDMTARKAVEEELRAAKEAAESANRMKSTFLSTITHELRTPMNGVLGLSAFLLETDLNAEQLDLVNTIRTSGNTLLALINDILDFSKIEANKVTLEPHTFDLRLCLEDALDLVAAQAAAKGLTLAYLLDPALPACFDQDETRLRQILANLLSNAVKFSDSGEVVVSVTGECQEQQWTLHCAVRDNGIGINAQQLARLFQPFTQAEADIARRFGGTGLGLAISKRLAELMGGTMWVDSTPGQGSTFHFSIQTVESREQWPAWPIDRHTLQRRHALLVTHSPAIGQLVRQQLTAWGLTVTQAVLSSADPISAQLPQADVLIWEMMNSEHGAPAGNAAQDYQLLERLRQQAPQLPLLLLTQLGERPPALLQPGGLMVVAKPIHASQLHDALVTIISGNPQTVRRSARSYTVDRTLAERHPLRILLAEDTVVNQKVVTGILANHGYTVDVAADGLEVLDALNRQPYDLVLMDVNMPELDGLATTSIIRSSWAADVQPYIIALTANAMADDHKRCLAVGMNDYVSKPIQVVDFMAAIQRAPSRHSQPDKGQPSSESATPLLVTEQTPSPVDLAILRELSQAAGVEGETLMNELIALFLESSLPLLEQLRKGAAAKNAAVLSRAAHTLRSPAGQLGAQRLAHLCQCLEDHTAVGAVEQACLLVDEIEAEYTRVRQMLTTHA